MKIVAIGDIHGRDVWKKIISQENVSKNDIVIFVGDYFDSFDIPFDKQLSNFTDIMEYQSNNNCICLIGNHDYHYMLWCKKRYNGFQLGNSFTIGHMLMMYFNLGSLLTCYADDNVLFTHAGVTKSWINKYSSYMSSNLMESINELMLYKPSCFEITGEEKTGNSVYESPIWVRPAALRNDMIEDYIQVVGHTEQVRGIFIESSENKIVCFIDALCKSQYLVIQNNEFFIRTIN